MVINNQRSATRFITGGLFSLFIAMGVGRFAYTPLLPGMQNEFDFSDASAGLIASLNFVGYLLGALLCRKSLTRNMKFWGFRWALILSLLTTSLMGLCDGVAVWMLLRLLGGIASAGVFVLGSAIVIDEMQQCAPLAPTMLIYSGVGLGIAFSGLAAPFLTQAFGVMDAWIWMTVLCLPMAMWSWVTLNPHSECSIQPAMEEKGNGKKHSSILGWLLVAYFCEGFGYIVSGTFIVSFLQNTTGAGASASTAWVIVGLTASVSVPLFQFMSKRWGPVRVLILAHFLQALGIFLPVVSSHWLVVYSGACLFGSTFMGIVALALLLGKTIRPEQSHQIIGLLTAIYGVGQILGPLVSGVLSTQTGNFRSALVLSSAMVALGGILLVVGKYRTSYALQGKVNNKKEKSHAVR